MANTTQNSNDPATFTGTKIEEASTLAPVEEETASDTKIELLLAGEPPNTMATGNPKPYTTTEAHEDSSQPKEASSSSSSSSSSAQGAMGLVGAGVTVAALATNAGGIKNAAADIAAAAAGAIASKAGEIVGEYSAKFVSLPLSIPSRIAKYTGERFGKCKI